jgi:LysR family glycine cleavage system transcriptional activator
MGNEKNLMARQVSLDGARTARVPSFELLQTLSVCTRLQSFSRAARELHLSPAAVSLRMRALEEDLGVTLFRRSGSQMLATPAAAQLAEQVRQAEAILGRAVRGCADQADIVRLTVVPTFAQRWLVPRLNSYQRQPAAAALKLDVSPDLRATADFDLAVRTGVGPWSAFHSIPLAPVELSAVLSPALMKDATPASPEDLAHLPLLNHDDWPRWFAAAGVQPPRLVFGPTDYPTYEACAAAAVQGEGVALLPPRFFERELHESRLIQPFDVVLQGPAWHYLLRHPHDTRPAVQGFCAWLVDEIRTSGLRPELAPVGPSGPGA